MDMSSSQKSIGRLETGFLIPSVGIAPKIWDWNDSLGEEGNMCLPSSSIILGWPLRDR